MGMTSDPLVEVVAKGKYARRITLLTPGALDALEGERGVLPDRVERGEEDAETQSGHEPAPVVADGSAPTLSADVAAVTGDVATGFAARLTMAV